MNIKPTKIILISTLLSIAVSQTGYSRVASASLTEVIKGSDLIAVGTVSEVTKVNGYRVAKLKIEGVLKGNAQTSEAFFLASPTWTCDVSDAKVGERGLYFLSTQTRELEFPSRHNGQPIFLIAHSGYGRLLSHEQGKFRNSSMIDLPKSFPVEEFRQSDTVRLELISTKDVARLIRQVKPSQR